MLFNVENKFYILVELTCNEITKRKYDECSTSIQNIYFTNADIQLPKK